MKKTQFAFATFVSAVAAQGLSAVDLKVVNETTSPVNVFVRGNGSEQFYLETVAPKTNQTLAVMSDKIDNKPTFDVVAAKEDVRIPDWKVPAGTCSNMSTTQDHTIVIENAALGLKTICKVVE